MKFERKVWKLIEKIPEGKVTTYKMIAEKLNTKAYRAVGRACNRNPDAPEVPCHRVVGSDGRVGGYAYGTRKKIELLKKENVKIVNCKIVDLEKVLFRFR